MLISFATPELFLLQKLFTQTVGTTPFGGATHSLRSPDLVQRVLFFGFPSKVVTAFYLKQNYG